MKIKVSNEKKNIIIIYLFFTLVWVVLHAMLVVPVVSQYTTEMENLEVADYVNATAAEVAYEQDLMWYFIFGNENIFFSFLLFFYFIFVIAPAYVALANRSDRELIKELETRVRKIENGGRKK